MCAMVLSASGGFAPPADPAEKFWPYFERIPTTSRTLLAAPSPRLDAVASPPAESPEHCCVVLWRNQYLLAVCQGQLLSLRLESYEGEPITGWERIAIQGKGPSALLSAAVVIGSKLIVHGGLEPAGAMTGAMHVTNLNPPDKRWVQVYQKHDSPDMADQLPIPVCQHTLSLWKPHRKLILHGGASLLSPKLELTDQTWVFDLKEQTWEKWSGSGTRRAGHTTAVLHGSMIVAGGIEENGALSWQVSVLILEAQVWRSVTSSQSPLSQDLLLSPMCIDAPAKAIWWSGGARLDLSNLSRNPTWKLYQPSTLPRIEAKCPWAASAASGVIHYVVDNTLWTFYRGAWQSLPLDVPPKAGSPGESAAVSSSSSQGDPTSPQQQQQQQPLSPCPPPPVEGGRGCGRQQQHGLSPLRCSPAELRYGGGRASRSPPPLALPRPVSMPHPAGAAHHHPRAPRADEWQKELAVIKAVLQTSSKQRQRVRPRLFYERESEGAPLGPSHSTQQLTANLAGCTAEVVSRIMALACSSRVLDLSGVPLTSADYYLVYVALRRHPLLQRVDCSGVPLVDDISARAVVATLMENPRITRWGFEGAQFESAAHRRMVAAHVEANLSGGGGRVKGQHQGRLQHARNRVLQQHRRRRELDFARIKARVLHGLQHSQGKLAIEQGEGRGSVVLEQDFAYACLLQAQWDDKELLRLRQIHCNEQEKERAVMEDREETVRNTELRSFVTQRQEVYQEHLQAKRALEELLAERAKKQRAERESLAVMEKSFRGDVKEAQEVEWKPLRTGIIAKLCALKEKERQLAQRREEEERVRREEEQRVRLEEEKKKRLQAEAEMKRRSQLSELSWQESTAREKMQQNESAAHQDLTGRDWAALLRQTRQLEMVGNAKRQLAQMEKQPPTFKLTPPASKTVSTCTGAPSVVNRPLSGLGVVASVPVPSHLQKGVMHPHNTEDFHAISARRSVVEAGWVLIHIDPEDLASGEGGCSAAAFSASVPPVSVLDTPFRVSPEGRVFLKDLGAQNGEEGDAASPSIARLNNFTPLNLEKIRIGVVSGETHFLRPSTPGSPPPGLLEDEATARLGVMLEITRAITPALLSQLFHLVSLVLPFGSLPAEGTRLPIQVFSSLRFAGMPKITTPQHPSVFHFSPTLSPMALGDSLHRAYQEGSGKLKLLSGSSVTPTVGEGGDWLTVTIHAEGLGREDRLTYTSGNASAKDTPSLGVKLEEPGWLMLKPAPAGPSPTPGALPQGGSQAAGVGSPEPPSRPASASEGVVGGEQVRGGVPPEFSCTVFSVGNTAKDVRALFKGLSFSNASNDPEEFERLFTVAVRVEPAGCPVVLGVVRLAMITSDDPSVLDFGVFTPSWRQVAKDVPLQLQGYLPPQPTLPFAQFGFISDVDTDAFSGGRLAFSLASGQHKGDRLTLSPMAVQNSRLFIAPEGGAFHPGDVSPSGDGPAHRTGVSEGDVISYIVDPAWDATSVQDGVCHPDAFPDALCPFARVTQLTSQAMEVTFMEKGATIPRADELFRCAALAVEGSRPPKEARTVMIHCEFHIGAFPVHSACAVRVTQALISAPSASCMLNIKEDAGQQLLCPKFEVLEHDDGWDGGYILIEMLEGHSPHDTLGLMQKGDVKLGPPRTREKASTPAPSPAHAASPVAQQHLPTPGSPVWNPADDVEDNDVSSDEDVLQMSAPSKSPRAQQGGGRQGMRRFSDMRDQAQKAMRPIVRQRLEKRKQVARAITFSIAQSKRAAAASCGGGLQSGAELDGELTPAEQFQRAQRLSDVRDVVVGGETVGSMSYFPDGSAIIKFKTGRGAKRMLASGDSVARKETCDVKRKDVLSILRCLAYQNSCKATKITRKVIRVTAGDGLAHSSATIHEVNIETIDDATEICRPNAGIRQLQQGSPLAECGFLPCDDCTLVDPDTFAFNGGIVSIAPSSSGSAQSSKRAAPTTRGGSAGAGPFSSADSLRILSLEEQEKRFDALGEMLGVSLPAAAPASPPDSGSTRTHPEVYRLEGTRHLDAILNSGKRTLFRTDPTTGRVDAVLPGGAGEVFFGVVAVGGPPGGGVSVTLAPLPEWCAARPETAGEALAGEARGIVTLRLLEDFLGTITLDTARRAKPAVSAYLLKVGAADGGPVGRARIQIGITPPLLAASPGGPPCVELTPPPPPAPGAAPNTPQSEPPPLLPIDRVEVTLPGDSPTDGAFAVWVSPEGDALCPGEGIVVPLEASPVFSVKRGGLYYRGRDLVGELACTPAVGGGNGGVGSEAEPGPASEEDNPCGDGPFVAISVAFQWSSKATSQILREFAQLMRYSLGSRRGSDTPRFHRVSMLLTTGPPESGTTLTFPLSIASEGRMQHSFGTPEGTPLPEHRLGGPPTKPLCGVTLLQAGAILPPHPEVLLGENGEKGEDVENQPRADSPRQGGDDASDEGYDDDFVTEAPEGAEDDRGGVEVAPPSPLPEGAVEEKTQPPSGEGPGEEERCGGDALSGFAPGSWVEWSLAGSPSPGESLLLPAGLREAPQAPPPQPAVAEEGLPPPGGDALDPEGLPLPPAGPGVSEGGVAQSSPAWDPLRSLRAVVRQVEEVGPGCVRAHLGHASPAEVEGVLRCVMYSNPACEAAREGGGATIRVAVKQAGVTIPQGIAVELRFTPPIFWLPSASLSIGSGKKVFEGMVLNDIPSFAGARLELRIAGPNAQGLCLVDGKEATEQGKRLSNAGRSKSGVGAALQVTEASFAFPQLEEDGVGTHEALAEAVHTRLAPVCVKSFAAPQRAGSGPRSKSPAVLPLLHFSLYQPGCTQPLQEAVIRLLP